MSSASRSDATAKRRTTIRCSFSASQGRASPPPDAPSFASPCSSASACSSNRRCRRRQHHHLRVVADGVQQVAFRIARARVIALDDQRTSPPYEPPPASPDRRR
jgi:hypothetical protein